jgi:3-oxoadipate enol-lactonase
MNRLPVTWHGRSDAPQLVLGNSLGTTQQMWEPLLSALGDRVRALTFDLPGHVRVETEEFTFDQIVERSGDALEAAGVRGAVFCGVSLGGAIGIALAARRPALIGRLVVVNAPIRQSSPQFWYDRAATADRDGLGAFASGLAERWFGPGADAGLVASIVEQFRGIPSAGYAQACRALADLDVTADAAQVAVPTLVVRGDADVAVPADNAVQIAAAIPGAELRVLPGAAHLLPVDHAGVLAAFLTETLEGTP